MLPCRRFADVLADACARLGADVGRYSFIAVDFHHIPLAGLPAHSLALRPAHSRRHLYVTCYTEGFSHFVTSMTAPVASGWSGRRVGLAPTGKRRLLTAHTLSRHFRSPARTSQSGGLRSSFTCTAMAKLSKKRSLPKARRTGHSTRRHGFLILQKTGRYRGMRSYPAREIDGHPRTCAT
jgi:hypothetical protein